MSNKVVLYNAKTGQPESVDVSKAKGLVDSGQYFEGSQTHVRADNTEVDVKEAGAQATSGRAFDSGAGAALEGRQDAHEKSLDTWEHAAETLGLGFTDALSFGLIHPHDEHTKEIQAAHEAANFIGEALGTAATLGFGGEAKGVEGVAKAAVGRAIEEQAPSRLMQAAARGVHEAGVGAALGAGHAFGSGVSDAIVENKPLTADAVLSEAGLGAAMGFVGGGLGSFLERGLPGVSRESVRLQQGVLDPASNESRALIGLVDQAHRDIDGVLEQHAVRVGELEALSERGLIPENQVEFRSRALQEARKAQRELEKVDTGAINGGDAKAYEKWKAASEQYQAAVKSLDEVMSGPGMLGAKVVKLQTPEERAANLSEGEAAKAEGLKIQDNIRKRDSDPGMPGMGVVPQVQAMMTPELEAQYASLHGQEFQDPRSGFTKMGTGPNQVVAPSGMELDQANLGGEVTPSSADRTNPGKMAKGTPPPVKGGGTEVLTGADSAPADQPAVTPKAPNEVEAYMRRWALESQGAIKQNPMQMAEMRIHNMLFDLNQKMGGRLDSVAGTYSWRDAGSSLTQRIDQVRQLRDMGSMAADEARGVATPLRDMAKEETKRSYLKEAAGTAAKIGAAEAVNKAVGGGPAGYMLGVALGIRGAGMAAKLASMGGRMAARIRDVGAAMLKNSSRSVPIAVAATRNVAYQYTPDGPEKDPLKRIAQIQELAMRPDDVAQWSQKGLGDINHLNPEIAGLVQQNVTTKIQTIAMMTPPLRTDPLGNVIPPGREAMRRFHECENAVWNPMDVLSAVANGCVTKTQMTALSMSAPAIHMALMQEAMGNPEALKTLNAKKRATVEMVMGQPIDWSKSPQASARTQASWAADAVTTAMGSNPNSSGNLTAPKPTPAQSSQSVNVK